MGVVVRGKRGQVRPDSINVLRGQQTRRRILDSARARILAGGFEGLHLDDVARDVGITKAAVIKSVGGKAALLLAVGEQDIAGRHEIIRHASTRKTSLRRRLADAAAALFALDAARVKLAQAYVGYLSFWTGADHDRAQGHVDVTLGLLRDLVRSAPGPALPEERVRILALRMMTGYVVGLRDLHYGRSNVAEAARLVVDYTLA